MKKEKRKRKTYKIKDNTHQRLAEMGFIKGAVFSIIKRVAGMLQLRLDNSSNDVVVREEELKTNVYGDDDWATPDKENK